MRVRFAAAAVSLILTAAAPAAEVAIPRLAQPPRLDDIAGMEPQGAAGLMARFTPFVQSQPRDGDPATQRTEAYLGYDDKALYIAWICFDAEPGLIRAQLAPREQAFGDDYVQVTLDTFQDRRRGYVFQSNPRGVQADGLWSEDNDQPDWSWDTTWESWARTTDRGYVVLLAIPFKSLRFPSGDGAGWGIVLLRRIARNDEMAYWPRVSSTIRGHLSQEGVVTGIENVSPGRNIQITPYGFASDDWAIDPTDVKDPTLVRKPVDVQAGVDGKFVFREKVVLDATLNPDFSQVESDQPQIAVNQRFELFYPEKRPFFLENQDLFQLTSFPLLFTRRIVDPSVGVRVTGKDGKLGYGVLVADDEAPGKIAPPGDPEHGSRAWFGIASVRYDILKESSLRLFVSDREYRDGFNRVGGLEANFKLGKNWTLNAAGFASGTREQDGTEIHGPAYEFLFQRSGRQLNTFFEYVDIARDFRAQAGFIPRVDVRQGTGEFQYLWRPEGQVLISYGPELQGSLAYDQSGTRLDWFLRPSFHVNLLAGTYFEVFYRGGRERLRPEDLAGFGKPGLAEVDLPLDRQGIFFGTDYFKKVSVYGDWRWGHSTNYFTPATEPPNRAGERLGSLEIVLRPVTPLTIDWATLYSSLVTVGDHELIFRDVISRLKTNWQFDLRWSLRLILEYDDVRSDPLLVAAPTERNRRVNTDILVTWLAHPGTALFFGFNTNSSNLADLEPVYPGINRGDALLNDGRRVFVKFSYQFRL